MINKISVLLYSISGNSVLLNGPLIKTKVKAKIVDTSKLNPIILISPSRELYFPKDRIVPHTKNNMIWFHMPSWVVCNRFWRKPDVTAPTAEVMKVKISEISDEVLKKSVVANIKDAYKYINSEDLEFVMEQTIDFCKNKVLKKQWINQRRNENSLKTNGNRWLLNEN